MFGIGGSGEDIFTKLLPRGVQRTHSFAYAREGRYKAQILSVHTHIYIQYSGHCADLETWKLMEIVKYRSEMSEKTDDIYLPAWF